MPTLQNSKTNGLLVAYMFLLLVRWHFSLLLGTVFFLMLPVVDAVEKESVSVSVVVDVLAAVDVGHGFLCYIVRTAAASNC